MVTQIRSRISHLIEFHLKAIIIVAMALLVLGAGLVQAAFYRTIGDEGFRYGYGYSSDAVEFGYGYGYLESELDEDNTEDHGFLGDDGDATGVSATAARNAITVTYSTDYLARNSIEYGTTDAFGAETALTAFQSGSNSIEVKGLSCNTTYHFRVVSTDAGGNEWNSTETSHTIKTLSCGGGGGGGGSSSSGSGSGSASFTNAEVQQILSILAALGVDQATLNSIAAILGGDAPSAQVPSFNRDLTLGSVGEDVRALQRYLNAAGFAVAASGPGSPGNETDYFGPLTQAALARFQAANGISPAAGYFGPITRAFIAGL